MSTRIRFNMRLRRWILAAAVGVALLGVPLPGTSDEVQAIDSDDFQSFDLLLNKTKLKLTQVLEGDPAATKARDKLKMVFEIPESIGDLQAGDRIALGFTGYTGDDLTGRQVMMGDRDSAAPDQFIELVASGGKGRLKAAKGATLEGFRVKAKYRPIRPTAPAQAGKKPRNGRLIVLLTRGLFGDLPFLINELPDPRVAFILGGTSLLTELLILRNNAQRHRLGCYRGDFALVALVLALQDPTVRILRATMRRR